MHGGSSKKLFTMETGHQNKRNEKRRSEKTKKGEIGKEAVEK